MLVNKQGRVADWKVKSAQAFEGGSNPPLASKDLNVLAI